MKTVNINNLGLRQGPSVTDANIRIEVTDEIYEKISSWPGGKIWQYDYEQQDFFLIDSPIIADLRFIRAQECFPIINRGFLWYDSLSSSQKQELREWYQAWLDVSETQIIPEKPTWLK